MHGRHITQSKYLRMPSGTLCALPSFAAKCDNLKLKRRSGNSFGDSTLGLQDYIHKVPVILHDNLQRGSHKPYGPSA